MKKLEMVDYIWSDESDWEESRRMGPGQHEIAASSIIRMSGHYLGIARCICGSVFSCTERNHTECAESIYVAFQEHCMDMDTKGNLNRRRFPQKAERKGDT